MILFQIEIRYMILHEICGRSVIWCTVITKISMHFICSVTYNKCVKGLKLTCHWASVCSILVHCRQSWPSILSTLVERLCLPAIPRYSHSIVTRSQCVNTFSWHLLQPRANAEHDSMSIYFYLSCISHERDNSHWATVILSERHAIVVKMIIT